MQIRSAFISYERMLLKITSIASHLSFIETCIDSKTLPIYKDIFIYIFIFVHLCVSITVFITLLHMSRTFLRLRHKPDTRDFLMKCL